MFSYLTHHLTIPAFTVGLVLLGEVFSSWLFTWIERFTFLAVLLFIAAVLLRIAANAAIRVITPLQIEITEFIVTQKKINSDQSEVLQELRDSLQMLVECQTKVSSNQEVLANTNKKVSEALSIMLTRPCQLPPNTITKLSQKRVTATDLFIEENVTDTENAENAENAADAEPEV